LQEELLFIWQTRRVTLILVAQDVEEAVYLGDRVLVMQANPGRVTWEVPTDLPQPRDRASHRFRVICQPILRDIDGMKAAE
jgi:ABC-type nitrate/sulfonate/bicarbonate transport system ATPase subunit